MRMSRFAFALACSMSALIAPSILPAQITSTFSGGPVSFHGRSKVPFTATSTVKNVQTLANGATVTSQNTTKVALDSSGRIYTETHMAFPTGGDGEPRELVSYHVSDPVAKTNASWNSNFKQITVYHQPDSADTPQPVAPPPHPNAIAVQPPRIHHPAQEDQSEDLGTKTIAGYAANGSRVTRIIPAGRDGNDQPLTITDECWRSPEFGVVLLSIHDDPRSGVQTRETIEFQPGEPDPALFQAPEGYAVRDFTPTVKTQELSSRVP